MSFCGDIVALVYQNTTRLSGNHKPIPKSNKLLHAVSTGMVLFREPVELFDVFRTQDYRCDTEIRLYEPNFILQCFWAFHLFSLSYCTVSFPQNDDCDCQCCVSDSSMCVLGTVECVDFVCTRGLVPCEMPTIHRYGKN